MAKAVVAFNSGQLDRYAREVAPLKQKLKRNNKVNWTVCLAILLLSAVAGVVIGFFLLPTMLGMFTGLLGGSVAGIILLLVYYFVRVSILAKTKKRAERGLSACKAAYLGAYEIPESALRCEILASSFLSKEYYGQSLIYARDDGSISLVAPSYENERNEIRYSPKTVIAYSLLSDSRVLVQSEEGYVVLSPEAKMAFVSSDLPLLHIEASLLFDLSETTIRAFTRPMRPLQRRDTGDNRTWKEAMNALFVSFEKERI